MHAGLSLPAVSRRNICRFSLSRRHTHPLVSWTIDKWSVFTCRRLRLDARMFLMKDMEAGMDSASQVSQDQTLVDFLERVAQRSGTRPALLAKSEDGFRAWSYADLWEGSGRVAAMLQGRGLKKGDRAYYGDRTPLNGCWHSSAVCGLALSWFPWTCAVEISSSSGLWTGLGPASCLRP